MESLCFSDSWVSPKLKTLQATPIGIIPRPIISKKTSKADLNRFMLENSNFLRLLLLMFRKTWSRWSSAVSYERTQRAAHSGRMFAAWSSHVSKLRMMTRLHVALRTGNLSTSTQDDAFLLSLEGQREAKTERWSPPGSGCWICETSALPHYRGYGLDGSDLPCFLLCLLDCRLLWPSRRKLGLGHFEGNAPLLTQKFCNLQQSSSLQSP